MTLQTISPTQIQTYLMCARKYLFRYVLRLPAEFKSSALAFGSAVHSALQAFHEKRLEGITPPPDEILDVFRIDWAAEEAGDLRFKDGEDAASLRALGEALVRLYVTEHPDLQVRAAEWPFEVPLADPATGEVFGPELRGKFDLLLDGDRLVEIKTAARAYDDAKLRINVQFSAYAYAYRSMFKADPKVSVVALLKQKKPRLDRYEVQRTLADDVWFIHLAAEVARGIETEAFPPNPGWPCGECEYQSACAAWRGATSVIPPEHATNQVRHANVCDGI